jgi:hypothetical protein
MERILSLTGGAAAAAVLALACGCTTPGKPGSSFSLFSKQAEMPQPTRPPGDNLDGGIRQASATIPAGSAGTAAAASGLSFAKLFGKGDKQPAAGKSQAVEMTVLWQPRLAHVAEMRGGTDQVGLAGNLLLLGPGDQPIVPNGKLTVSMYDVTPRAGGAPAAPIEVWTFTKEDLRKTVTSHELFGKSYVVFLWWPAYRPDITRVRLTTRYDPEQGYPLHAEPVTLTIDASNPLGAPVWSGTTQTFVPGQTPGQLPPGFGPTPPPGGPPAGLPPTAGGLMPSAGFGPPTAGAAPPAGAGAIPLLPPGNPQVPPGGLPTIVITPQMRGQ